MHINNELALLLILYHAIRKADKLNLYLGSNLSSALDIHQTIWCANWSL